MSDKMIYTESIGSTPGVYEICISEDAKVFALDFEEKSDVLRVFVLESSNAQRESTRIDVVSEIAYFGQRVDYFVGWFNHPNFGRLFVFVLR